MAMPAPGRGLVSSQRFQHWFEGLRLREDLHCHRDGVARQHRHGSGSTVTPSTAPSLRKVVVDAGSTAGTLRSLQGVNGAPLPNVHKPAGLPLRRMEHAGRDRRNGGVSASAHRPRAHARFVRAWRHRLAVRPVLWNAGRDGMGAPRRAQHLPGSERGP